MNSEKHALTSITNWGAISIAIPFLLRLLGIKVSGEEASALLAALQILIDQGLTIGGLIAVVHGRWRAKSSLYLFRR